MSKNHKLNLNDHWKDILANLPESSIGSQNVLITIKNKEDKIPATVYNGEICTTNEEIDPNDIMNIEISK